MADLKISQLTSVSQANIASTTDVLPIVNAGATKKATAYAITYSSLNASVATTFAYDATPTVAARVGVQGTGTSWIFNTPSGNAAYAAGLVIDGTYDGGTLQAEINLRALGIYSGGGYGSELSLWTSNGTAITRQVTVKSSGDVQVKTGNLVIGTSGKGIDFSATPGTGTSELLADYEEGTWTPVVVGSSTPGTGTYTTQVGRYTKIGNRVFFNLNLNWSAHTGSGDMSISGLPFTSNSTSDNASSLSAWVSNLTLSALNILTPIVNTNSTSVSFFQTPAGGGAVGLVTLDTSAQVIISGHYEV